MSRMASAIGLPDANGKVLHLAKVLMFLGPLANFTFVMSTTFYMIFVAEALGGGDYIQGLPLVGTLIVIQMAIQLLLDYPTGAIGDWIGQRYIMASSTICYAVAFYMVSLVSSTTPFSFLIVIYVIQGLGNSQQSGAFNTWFDNNYRVAMPGDSDRKQYGMFWGRMGMIMQIVSTAALIPGSILAAVFGRAWVFQLQAVLAIVLTFLSLRYIRDFPEVEAAREERPNMAGYTKILKDGVSYLMSEPFVKHIVIGSMLATSSIMVWGNLILFPMYFSYLITDTAVASFRTALFVPGIFSQERSGVWSRRFEPEKWIPRFRLIQTCGFVFFWVFALVMFFFPPATNGGPMLSVVLPIANVELMQIPVGNILPVVIIFFCFTLTSFFGAFAEILTQRVLLDAIPNRIRNSMYSLSPTIATLFALPQIGLFGFLIPTIGFPLTLALCGLVSLIGVLQIRKGLSYPKPILTEDAWAAPPVEAEMVVEEFEEELIREAVEE
ncbi:MAG: MFS transporter [Candidatus Thorarchaeota archaeon]|nr:MFS transporter [Candidatus Thorarchaeota archaeon]